MVKIEIKIKFEDATHLRVETSVLDRADTVKAELDYADALATALRETMQAHGYKKLVDILGGTL